jgi:VCBS repeat protein
VDINGDGFGDILSGSYSRMERPMAGLFQVLWGKADKTFQTAEALKGSDDKPLVIPLGTEKDAWIDCICTRPTVVDWDGDGKLDLISGNFTGTFYLFTGEGKGRFQPIGELVTIESGPLKIRGNHSDPFIVDWDRDGDLDLLSGSSEGGVEWSENIAGKGKPPKLKPFRSLIDLIVVPERGERLSEDDLKGPTSNTRIWVDDVNSDGKLDILVGDSVMLVEPAKGLSDEELKAKSAEWQKEWDAALAEWNLPDADEKKRTESEKRVRDLHDRRSSFVHEEMTGFVWLYLQK